MASSSMKATLRSLERMVHASQPLHYVTKVDPKTGVVTQVLLPGVTYRKPKGAA